VKGWDQLTFGQMVFNQLAFGPNDVVSSAPIYLYQSFFSKSCIEKKQKLFYNHSLKGMAPVS